MGMQLPDFLEAHFLKNDLLLEKQCFTFISYLYISASRNELEQ